MSVRAQAGHFILLIALFAAVMVAVGIGEARADPLAGKTYADATETVAGWGSKVIVTSVVGGSLPRDKCIVTASQKAPAVSNDNFDHRSGFLLALNCGAQLASGGSSGNSLMTPEGRAAKKDLKSVDWINTTPEGSEWCTSNTTDCKTLCDRTGSCSAETLSTTG
ncbi:hypothetical protein [Mycolicibacterium sp. J2]|uniref:hypothetical protein n=1 Tax=Mycolicibacterium sp. J2 TaxID=2993511 RepID=UPI00224B6BCD|nr:hypothetical protein [Mycolicibacterium sp. J2]MCX2713127.1 hypothetical protein [Mycolicibacterium sp. J2]